MHEAQSFLRRAEEETDQQGIEVLCIRSILSRFGDKNPLNLLIGWVSRTGRVLQQYVWAGSVALFRRRVSV